MNRKFVAFSLLLLVAIHLCETADAIVSFLTLGKAADLL